MVRHGREGRRNSSRFHGLLLWLVLLLGLGAAGPLRAATFSGRVINDLNGNGVIDAGDAPLGGVIVQLRTGATRGFTLAQAVTNANGDYAFINVPAGTFRLVDLIPAGATAIAAIAGPGGAAVDATTIRLTVVDGEFISGNNFLVRASVVSPTGGTISGSVLQDSNGNGVLDAGDAPIPNVQIQLFTQLGVFVAQATTNLNGAYAFTNVPPGSYLIQQIVPANFVALTPTVLPATSISGFNNGNNNFLDRSTVVSPTVGIISGSVIRDLNNNGVVDSGDAGLPGVTVQLFTQLNAFIAQTTTDANGAYAFTNLPPGSYRVVQVVPAGYVALTSTVLAVNVIAGVNNGNNNFLDRSTTPPATATISGSVVQDTNGNGVLSAGDAPLPGVTVQLRNTAGTVLAQFVTDGNGAYAFSGLAPGTYQVVQIVPINFTAIAAYPGLGGVALSATIIQVTTSGGLSGNNNFLDRATVVSPTVGSLSGTVFRDANLNGFLDAGDAGIPGVTVQLFTQIGIFVAQTTTGANGAYSFTNLPPGSYLVSQVVPSGYVAITPTVLSVTVIAGVNNSNNNFLDRLTTPPATATISGSVVQDTNGNGVLNAGDAPLPGVTVQLRNTAGTVLAQFVTDANGAYVFGGLTPGTYQVVQIVPTNFIAIAAFPGPGGIALSPTVIQVTASGGLSGNNNFLDRAVVVSPTVGSLSGAVLQDTNGNGVIDAGDTGLSGVTVQLFTQLNAFVAQTTTGAGGAFSFSNLPPGAYRVAQVVPTGYVAVTATVLPVTVIAGANNGNNNFLDRLAAPPSAATISGSVLQDTNGNGFIDLTDTPLQGVLVQLRNLSGAVLSQFFTDANGAYAFSGVGPGTYQVVQIVPTNLVAVAAFPGPGGVVFRADIIQIATSGGLSGNNNFLDRAGVVSPTVGSISGTVLFDANGNAVLDQGDTGLPGVTVQLATLLGIPVGQTTTDANGAYSFTNLPPGSYQVTQVVPAGLVPLTPNVRGVTVVADVNQGNINFLDGGSGPPVGTNTISGFAIRDLNLNGIADSEPGLPGVVVTLRNASNVVIANTTTGVTGAFSFTGLPSGSYTLTATAPFGLFNTNAIPGQGGSRLSAATIGVTTTIGITSYPGQLFLAGP